MTQLRDFREGDEVRAMHWKQTARQQRLVVVERQRASEKPIFFFVDPRLENPSDAHQLERFERHLSEVATGVVQRLREGVRVGLVVGQLVVLPVHNPRRAPLLLRPLAEIEAISSDEAPPAVVDNGRARTFTANEDGSR